MSRIYFHSPSGEAELWGGERAWLGGLCSDVTSGILDVRRHEDARDAVRELVRPGFLPPYPEHGAPNYFEDFSRWCSSAELAIRAGDDGLLNYRGTTLDGFSLTLNTACQLGGHPLKLAARIHGQCEIHCYCEGIDRAWLAGIIDEGLDSGTLRHLSRYWPDLAGKEWEDIARFLRDRDDEPVVLSYSVCDSFPNEYTAHWEAPDDNEDAWYDLPFAERWDLSMRGLRESGGGLRLDPADWGTFHFGHGLSAFDLRAPDWSDRLTAALSPDPSPALR